MDLTIDTLPSSEPGQVLLAVSGSLDLESRGRLIAAGEDALATEGNTGLSLDLSGVDFIDSTGIGAVIHLNSLAEDDERTFAVVNPSPRVVRVLTVSGLAEAWAIGASTDPGDR